MKGLIPIGFSDFREIIERGFRYIDKTRYVHTLCTTGKYYFLSRPRRFGKSLHISLNNELYSGSKSLFEGLWIYDHWDWEKILPVIQKYCKDMASASDKLELKCTNKNVFFSGKGEVGIFDFVVTCLAINLK